MERKRTKRLTVPFWKVNREPGYYWVRVSNGQNSRWIIAKWYDSLKFFDTMVTIREMGHRDSIVEVDENQLKRE
jgi:hypothetical protein